MMRLALFEISGVYCAVALDQVLHVLTGPHLFMLPLLRACFAGGLVYQDQIVPLLNCEHSATGVDENQLQPGFVLVCEAELGLLGVPADRIVRITNTGEINPETFEKLDSGMQVFEIDGRDFRLLDLDQVMDDPDFTVCRLKD